MGTFEGYDDESAGERNDDLEEEQDGASVEVKPWNPDLIRIHTKTFSIRQILDMIDDHEVDLAPDFQLLYVWKDFQKSQLIESILLGIPMPVFYFNQTKDGAMQVVDGVQRLTTIHHFGRKTSLELVGLQYLKDRFEHKKFDALDPVWRRRFHNTQLYVHVIDPQTPDAVKYDIFRRINTGGTRLNSQEIRHCMSGPRSRQFLLECASEPAFHRATGNVLKQHKRMVDREMVLRFCAFRLLGVDQYRSYDGVDAFLGKAVEVLDSPRTTSDAALKELRQGFVRSMENADALFGKHAFRKRTLQDVARNAAKKPLNRGLLESWSVCLADYAWERLDPVKDRIVGLTQEMMETDNEYLSAITTSTGDRKNVECRFGRVREILRRAGC